ncbi:hypothetical protein KC335_g105 [Hortaea werneckii]|nr:hypothetical protein KC335_g105 [Hortaea werneckii]
MPLTSHGLNLCHLASAKCGRETFHPSIYLIEFSSGEKSFLHGWALDGVFRVQIDWALAILVDAGRIGTHEHIVPCREGNLPPIGGCLSKEGAAALPRGKTH